MESIVLTRSFGTHSGSFHADEVTACALLLTFNLIDKTKIVRTRSQELLSRCEYVCDVGGLYDPESKRFDHHQVEYQGQLSSAGMILKYLKDESIITPSLFHFLNTSLVMGVDAHDNGAVTPLVGHCSFSGVIHNFTPIEYEASDDARDDAFYKALEFTLGHLRRLVERHAYIEGCKDEVQRVMRGRDSVLIFDKPLPWLESFFECGGETHPARFVVMPSGGHWKLRGIPPTYEKRMDVRMPLPAQWAGKSLKELQEVSGIRGSVFCHKGRFISVWETKEDALLALKKIEEME